MGNGPITETLPCEISCYLWVDSVTMELSCGTPSWCPEHCLACGGTAPATWRNGDQEPNSGPVDVSSPGVATTPRNFKADCTEWQMLTGEQETWSWELRHRGKHIEKLTKFSNIFCLETNFQLCYEGSQNLKFLLVFLD